MSPVQFRRLSRLLHQKALVFSVQGLVQIHAQLITTGLHGDQSCLLSLFEPYLSKPSTVAYVTAIFDRIQEPNTDKWRLMIRRCASDVEASHAITLFREMSAVSKHCAPVDEPFIFASLIKSCNRMKAVREGKSIHCHVLRIGLDCNVYILNSLIYFYSNSANSIGYACTLFDRIPQRTVVTVNSMISGYVKIGLLDAGLGLFIQALAGGFGLSIKPNYVTLVVLISRCAELSALNLGNLLHSYSWKVGLNLRSEVLNALIDMYTKLGCIADAERVFEEAPARDLISWNSMIMGYATSNESRKAFSLFREMRDRNIEFDRVSLVGLILAATNSRDICMGKAAHGYIERSGIVPDVSVQTALIKLYSKLGLIESARKVFDEQQADSIALWNSMIHGYAECGLNIEALSLFDMIESKKLKVDHITMLGLILACRNSGEVKRGVQIRSYIESRDHLNGSIVLCNALIDMYAKCGSMSEARALFDKMPRRDVISWTSIIVGSAINGEGEEALTAFRQMCAGKFEPNSITFIGVLSACDHSGLVDDGRNLYDIMCRVYHIEPKIEHCGCMVDMHARVGMLEEAYHFVKKMPIQPNAVVWRMLIHACKVHGHVNMGLSMVSELIELNTLHGPEDHIISSNIFAEAGRWNDVLWRRNLMRSNKASKSAGKSCVSCVTVI